MTAISKQQIFMCVAFVAPLAAVGAAKLFPLGAPPASAAAAGLSDPSAGTLTGAADLAFEIPKAFDQEIAQKSIAQIYRASRQKAFSRTPLATPPKPQPAIAPIEPVAVETLTPDQHLLDALTLVKSLEFTSILTGREIIAVISGRPRHVGDIVKKGWTLISIDPASNSVVLQHQLAGKHTLQLKQRSGHNSGDNESTIEPAHTPANPAR